jgi:dCTP diphosphatase
MADATTTIQDLKDRMRAFVAERDWAQFHDLKSLSMAIGAEAGELMDPFRWVDTRRAGGVMADPAAAREVRHEAADILLLLVEFAAVAGFDLSEAVAEKLDLNRRKYPVEKSRGRSDKHDRLG